jgi:hypothetical protein
MGKDPFKKSADPFKKSADPFKKAFHKSGQIIESPFKWSGNVSSNLANNMTTIIIVIVVIALVMGIGYFMITMRRR